MGALHGFIPVLVVTQLRVVSLPSELTEPRASELDQNRARSFQTRRTLPLLPILPKERKFLKQVRKGQGVECGVASAGDILELVFFPWGA